MEDVLKVVGLIALVVGLCLLAAYPTLYIVNYLFTPQLLLSVFGISALTFWKAFWLNFLASILFKSTNTSSK